MQSNHHAEARSRPTRTLLLVATQLLLSGCAHSPLAYVNAYTNVADEKCLRRPGVADTPSSYSGRATFNVTPARGRADTLVVLALSGGGSRAAYLSAKTMLRLQNVFAADGVDILSEVDVISSVSGGSLPAAYYAISTDPGEPNLYGRHWDEKTINKLMRKDYTLRWFGNWFWPGNILRYWFTGFDRTDIMAQTFADNLFDRKIGGKDLKMADLRPERPYLILNATNGTTGQFHNSFSFTQDDFDNIASNVNDYSLARAVMGTATFPAVFNYMTLRNFSSCASNHDDQQFIHVFDGGNSDNLGVISVIRVLETMRTKGTLPKKVIVILVDAFTDKAGVDPSRPDPRGATDFIIDSNFIASTDALLAGNRDKTLEGFKIYFESFFGTREGRDQSLFYQLEFADIKDPGLNKALNSISTNFSIAGDDAAHIDDALALLLTEQNPCLAAIKSLLKNGKHSLEDVVCKYSK